MFLDEETEMMCLDMNDYVNDVKKYKECLEVMANASTKEEIKACVSFAKYYWYYL